MKRDREEREDREEGEDREQGAIESKEGIESTVYGKVWKEEAGQGNYVIIL